MGVSPTLAEREKELRSTVVLYKDMKLHVCEKAPRNKAFELLDSSQKYCPYCGVWLGSKKSAATDVSGNPTDSEG